MLNLNNEILTDLNRKVICCKNAGSNLSNKMIKHLWRQRLILQNFWIYLTGVQYRI